MPHQSPNLFDKKMTNSITNSSRRIFRGFTIVELLVVIAIIGVLVALALPALATARRTAQRNACMNNMRELSKAISIKENKNGRYPAAFMVSTSDTDPANLGATYKWPWVVPMLPLIGQEVLYEQLQRYPNLAFDGTQASPADINNRPFISSLSCPSDTTIDRSDADISYTPNMGQPDSLATEIKENGVFQSQFPPNEALKFGQDSLKDGTSYTIVITENLNARPWANVTPGGDPADEYQTGVVWLPSVPSFGVNRNADDLDATDLCDAAHARPSSNHPNVFNAAFADGSVRNINEEITYRTYRQLMAMDDETSFTASGLAVDPKFQADDLEP